MSQTPPENDPDLPGPERDSPEFRPAEEEAVAPTPADDVPSEETPLLEDDGVGVELNLTPTKTESDASSQGSDPERGSPPIPTESKVDDTAASGTAHPESRFSEDADTLLFEDDETLLIPRWLFNNTKPTESCPQKETPAGARIRSRSWPFVKSETFKGSERVDFVPRAPVVAQDEEEKTDNVEGDQEEEEPADPVPEDEPAPDEDAASGSDSDADEEPPKPYNPFDAASDDGLLVDDESEADTDDIPVEALKKDDDSKKADDGLDSTQVPKEDKKSPAEKEWARQKELGEKSEVLDKVMSLVGLENVKMEFLTIKATIEAARQRRGQLKRQDLNLVLMGNPGTGKRTIAKLYWDFLKECNVWPNDDDVTWLRKSGYDLQRLEFVSTLDSTLEDAEGAVLFIDSINGMDEDYAAYLLNVLDTHSVKFATVLSGDVEGTTEVLGSTPHGRWLFRRRLHLKDYDDEQLRLILLRLIHRNALRVEGGKDAAGPQIVAKRLGRNRGTPGFGNVHDLNTVFEQIMDRQSTRLNKAQAKPPTKGEGDSDEAEVGDSGEKKDDEDADGEEVGDSGEKKDDDEDADGGDEKDKDTAAEKETYDDGTVLQEGALLLTMEDMIGPEPIDIRPQSEAWKELDKMVGLEDVKKAVGALLDRAKHNYRRDILGKEPLKTSLNRVFLGPPGTGKTTVAKLYAKIVAEIALLSTKEVMYTSPGDFIGQYIGESEVKTSRILDSTVGKVLIIDDAHMFYHGSRAGTSAESDEFRLACIDVLISRIHNKPGEDRCVILLGYPEAMEEMFQKVNPGLRRRFPLEEAFRFKDYDDTRLNEILALKMAREGITADQPAMEVAAEVLRRARDRPNFGNGGDVDNLLNQAKARYRERRQKEKEVSAESAEKAGDDAAPSSATAPADDDDDDDELAPMVLERQDFDPEWDRGTRASRKCLELFEGLIGFEDVVNKFQGYQRMAANMRRRGKDPRKSIPFTFLFRGPPGTGKTHTARIIGQIFYDMGFLSTSEVVECSASHLIGQFMGQSAPKVINLFDRALGKVLFIDEAYRLGGGRGPRGGGSYEDEAVGELVDCMTKPRYLRKMIVVLAGYDGDMEELIKVNAGLRGRFATQVAFPPMSAKHCVVHLFNLLRKEDIEVTDEWEAGLEEKKRVLRLFDKLGMTAGWANARDVKTLAERITADVYEKELEDDEPWTVINNSKGKEKRVAEGSKGSEEEPGSDTGFSISTKRITCFLKQMLRERIKGGGQE
ncbi:P-loop containing nucleoside triphosphate hydrolase protein [Chaetomidium leptoderma]|uniref:P-loop containing nucleoside triphosphate hydrolase protein n=1 Tax=Chaetomidium leptoderma TaxID=669021 RepID=A0AAN7A1X4_9PEZI|nr:P-loop containing nucleoside triphosphate hydrolase protein [Chaetomidium leptoderma]